jgi:hypothetical protein
MRTFPMKSFFAALPTPEQAPYFGFRAFDCLLSIE